MHRHVAAHSGAWVVRDYLTLYGTCITVMAWLRAAPNLPKLAAPKGDTTRENFEQDLGRPPEPLSSHAQRVWAHLAAERCPQQCSTLALRLLRTRLTLRRPIPPPAQAHCILAWGPGQFWFDARCPGPDNPPRSIYTAEVAPPVPARRQATNSLHARLGTGWSSSARARAGADRSMGRTGQHAERPRGSPVRRSRGCETPP